MVAGALAASVVATAMIASAPPAPAQGAGTPNVIVVVTDDMRWDSLDSMPWLARRARREGAWFAQAYSSLPQCCPSRASVLTGRYVHNHEVWKSAASEKDGVLDGHVGLRLVEDHSLAARLDGAY